MFKILTYIKDIWGSATLRKKIIFTFAILALYRLLVFLPVPFIDIHAFMAKHATSGGGLEFFAMLLGGTIENFSIIAVGLVPYINSSIIMQLLTTVLPQLEELQEQGEAGTAKIAQYTRFLTLPLAFLQSIGMVYYINYIFHGQGLINTGDKGLVLLAAFTMTVGTMMLLWLGDMITEKGASNGTSLIIFSSIIAGTTTKVFGYSTTAVNDIFSVIIFMVVLVGVLIVLALYLVRTRKEIPITYARHGKIEETAVFPIPLNPVGMVPIIFSIAFVSFPYLLSQMILKFGTANEGVKSMADWISNNLNIYTQTPSILSISVYFILIVAFTFFYTLIMFNPDKIADNIQRRGGYVPGIRPGVETSKYINGLLMHLCLWGGVGLGLIGIYSYVISYIPFINQVAKDLGSIPIIVSGSGVIIIVGVVQDLINKFNAELLMERYDRL